MHQLSFILAVAVLLAAPSVAGRADASLPGVGTFSYSGSPIVASDVERIVVANR